MRYWTGAAVTFFFSLLQTSSVEQFDILGVAPNLILVLLVSWLVVRGFDDVLPMVAVAGVTTGLLGLQPPGVVLLALLVAVAPAGVLRELHILHSEPLLVLASAAWATLAYESVLLLYVMATGGALDPGAGIREAVAPAMIVNVALTPPVYVMMRLARPARAHGRLAF